MNGEGCGCRCCSGPECASVRLCVRAGSKPLLNQTAGSMQMRRNEVPTSARRFTLTGVRQQVGPYIQSGPLLPASFWQPTTKVPDRCACRPASSQLKGKRRAMAYVPSRRLQVRLVRHDIAEAGPQLPVRCRGSLDREKRVRSEGQYKQTGTEPKQKPDNLGQAALQVRRSPRNSLPAHSKPSRCRASFWR